MSVNGAIAETFPSSAASPTDQTLRSLTIAAIGIVFGDIGTSPLYALKACFDQGLVVNPENVLGLLSLVLWSLIVVVTVKYVLLIMHADNDGEGGILALMALVHDAKRPSAAVGAIGLFGASLFFGDGVITPAISVLSAVEGLALALPSTTPYILAISIAVLVALFLCQSHGTEKIGLLFGPIMLTWFSILGIMGGLALLENPAVLAAFNPLYAVDFFIRNGWTAFLALGGVVLAVTGGEALYADMGHFGLKPIRRAWLGFVMPALMLNYFGQCALILTQPDAVRNPFFLLAPEGLLLPLVVLATMATVIASQAVISGVFSATQQAVQLGFCPRMEVRHTSDHHEGQIFLPEANERLLGWVVVLVLVFQSSDRLANAYGIAVTGTMAATSLLFFLAMRRLWHWPLAVCCLVAGSLLAVDLAFFAANVMKVFDGGWIPLCLAALLATLMTSWRRGREILSERLRADTMETSTFLARLSVKTPIRIPGTAVYLTRHADMLPNALLHNLKHNKTLHDRVVFLTVTSTDTPRVLPEHRVSVTDLGQSFFHVVMRFGFTELPDIPEALKECARYGVEFDYMDTSYFLGRETLIPATNPPMPRWRERLFILLSKNAYSAAEYYRIPTDRVVELGAQVPI
jgi:KUP system potassium uptake protein